MTGLLRHGTHLAAVSHRDNGEPMCSLCALYVFEACCISPRNRGLYTTVGADVRTVR